jgi:hypothetical protein
MNSGGIGRFGLKLLVVTVLATATGCSSMSTAGWGPPPAHTSTPVAAQQGAPRFVQTTGMSLTKKDEAVKIPSWIRVQDCAIVAISTPARYACPDGKVYTASELYHERSGN